MQSFSYNPAHLLPEIRKPQAPRGAIVVCLGSEFRRLARIMIVRLLKSGWQYPIIAFSDYVENSFPVPIMQIPVLHDMNSHNGHLYKINSYFLTPFLDTLFLDADLLMGSDISDIWRFSGNCLSIVQERITPKLFNGPMDNKERNDTIKICPHDFPYYNSGVMLYRKCKEVENLFRTWHLEWRGKQDQPALCRSLCITKTPIIEMPLTYNFMLNHNSGIREARAALKTNKIVHFWCGLKHLMSAL